MLVTIGYYLFNFHSCAKLINLILIEISKQYQCIENKHLGLPVWCGLLTIEK